MSASDKSPSLESNGNATEEEVRNEAPLAYKAGTQTGQKGQTMKPNSVRVLKRDFDAAIKQDWTPGTCLIAQVAKRLKITDMYDLTVGKGSALMARFDDAFHLTVPDKRKLKRLRACLPVNITLTNER